MAPGSIFHHISLPTLSYFLCRLFYVASLFLFIIKIPKILPYHTYQILTLVTDREGLDNPFIALVVRLLFVCVGAWDLCVISYWIDTLVLKN